MRTKPLFSGVFLAVLLFLSQGMEAGTWSFKKWDSDRDIPQPAPDMVTHAIAFSPPKEAPIPSPFLSTNKIFGQTWAVSREPGHTKMLGVLPTAQGRMDNLRVGGEGMALLRGRVCPRGKEQEKGGAGLSLELTGLEPGHVYNLFLMGLGLSADRDSPGRENHQINVSSSDAPDQWQMLDADVGPLRNKPKFVVCEYTAPENGGITFFFKSADEKRNVQLAAFMNFRAD